MGSKAINPDMHVVKHNVCTTKGIDLKSVLEEKIPEEYKGQGYSIDLLELKGRGYLVSLQLEHISFINIDKCKEALLCIYKEVSDQVGNDVIDSIEVTFTVNLKPAFTIYWTGVSLNSDFKHSFHYHSSTQPDV